MKARVKARVKATGEIVEVKVVEIGYDYKGQRIVVYEDDKGRCYADSELDFDNPDNTPEEYWTRLEHQYAGMAMQGILSNPEIELDYEGNEGCVQAVTATATRFAHTLVEKMKEERK